MKLVAYCESEDKKFSVGLVQTGLNNYLLSLSYRKLFWDIPFQRRYLDMIIDILERLRSGATWT